MQKQRSNADYLRIKNFRDILRTSKILTFHQKSTLYGQAASGDLDGAYKGYEKLISVANIRKE
jgi:hypothetical protein